MRPTWQECGEEGAERLLGSWTNSKMTTKTPTKTTRTPTKKRKNETKMPIETTTTTMTNEAGKMMKRTKSGKK